MELLFESRVTVRGVQGRLRPVQQRPRVSRDPVLVGDSLVDGTGASIYGTVLRDSSGGLRMYYQAWPWDWNGQDVALVALAFSADGRDWEKPDLELQAYDDDDGFNNLVDLGFHSPSIWIDPEAPPAMRYRATGYSSPQMLGCPEGLTVPGYYAAHSDDGLRWTLDSAVPLWPEADVITSVYHPRHRRGLVAMKRMVHVHGVRRRAIWLANCRDGRWSDAACALVPDEYDDVCAQARGFVSGDYYGMGMLAAGAGTVGFLWQFRHAMPRSQSSETGIYGATDVTLVYQDGPDARWTHMPGRPDFISHRHVKWGNGGCYTASCPVEVGNEHWLYITGATRTHAWYLDRNWNINERRRAEVVSAGLARIGVARWPKWRLFGYQADPEGELLLNLGPIAQPCELILNYQCEDGGSLTVELNGVPGHDHAAATPLTGNTLGAPASWTHGTEIPPSERPIFARIFLDCATLWAYELRPFATEQRPRTQPLPAPPPPAADDADDDDFGGFTGEIRPLRGH